MGEELSGRREASASAAAERAKPWGASWPFLGTSPPPWLRDPPASPCSSCSSKALGAESGQRPHSGEHGGSGTVWVHTLLQWPRSHGHTSTTRHGTAQHSAGHLPCALESCCQGSMCCAHKPLPAQHGRAPAMVSSGQERMHLLQGKLWHGQGRQLSCQASSPSPAQYHSPMRITGSQHLHQRHAAQPGTAALTCAGAGAAAPLSGSRRSRRNPSLSSSSHRARARETAGQAVPEWCWHLPPPCQCGWQREAHTCPPRAMMRGSPSHGRAECWGWPLTAHRGSTGLCHVPRRPQSGASDAQCHPGIHRAAQLELAPVLKGCGQGPGVALPRLRSPAGQDEPCGASEAGGSSCPSPARSAHVALAGGGHRGQCPQHCWGKCPLHRTLQAGSGRIRQGLAGRRAGWEPRTLAEESCVVDELRLAGLVSPAEQPLALTAKPVCEY